MKNPLMNYKTLYSKEIRIYILSTIFLFISLFNYFGFEQIYWLKEMRIFIFLLAVIILFTFISISNFSRKISFSIGYLDMLFSTFILYSIIRSIFIHGNLSDEITLHIALLLLYILCRNCCSGNREKFIIFFYDLIITIALIQSIIGIFQYLEILPYFHNNIKSAGLFINPGIFGGFLAISICIYFHTLYSDIKKANYYLLVKMGIIFFALILSFSKSAWLATIISILICLVRDLRLNSIKHKKLSWAALMTLILSILFYLLNSNITSAEGRLLIWKIACSMIEKNMLFGSGTHSFFVQYGNTQSEYFINNLNNTKEVLTASMNYYAFNEFLRIVIELGIIGLTLYTSLLILILIKIPKAIFTRERIIYSMVTCIVIFSLFSYPFQDILISSIFVGSIAIIASGEFQTYQLFRLSLKKGYLLIFYVPLIALSFISLQKIKAFYQWKSANESFLMHEGDSKLVYAKLYKTLSNNGSFLFNYGCHLADIQDNENALDIFLEALEFGNSVELNTKIAQQYVKIKNFNSAEKFFIKAAYMNPKLFVPFENLFDYYVLVGDIKNSQKIASLIISKPIKINSTIVQRIRQKALIYILNEK